MYEPTEQDWERAQRYSYPQDWQWHQVREWIEEHFNPTLCGGPSGFQRYAVRVVRSIWHLPEAPD